MEEVHQQYKKMKNINEIDFEKKITEAPKDVSLFIANLYVDPILEQLVGEDVEDYLLIVDDLANQIAYFILNLLTIQEFKDNLAEVLYLEGSVEIQKAYDAINKFVLSKLNKNETTNGENKIDELKLKDQQNSISHHDVLNEIENPTPSINTTTAFQNSNTKAPSTSTSSTTVSSNPTKTLTPTSKNTPNQPTEPSLHSPAPIATYTNPALNIATKLGQNLDTPSASIPKDVYMSKKPDPYHEPVL